MATIVNTKAYRTHLEVLNGVFNLGYKGHQRSWAKIDDNSEVWFPTCHSGVVWAPAVCSEWTNIVDNKICSAIIAIVKLLFDILVEVFNGVQRILEKVITILKMLLKPW